MTRRTRIRRTLTFISFLAFPLTLNFFSPYVSISGALDGIVSGSVLVFALMFATGLIFRRSWCAYVCPNAALSDYAERINGRNVDRRKLAIIRTAVFTLWFTALAACFVLAGGIKGIQPLYMTENGISVDMPLKYVTYYSVVGLLLSLTLILGKRGACHSICWMSPFLMAGSEIGKFLKLPQIHVVAEPGRCIDCSQCNKACPMSIDVMRDMKQGGIRSLDCINCGQCEEACPKKALEVRFRVWDARGSL